MKTPSLAAILYGTDEPVAEPTALCAGALAMTLERGKLWNILVDDIEVWHGLGFVYRDVDWGTPDPIIDRVKTEIRTDQFVATCGGHVPCESESLPFEVRIEGRVEDHLHFTAEAIPTTDVRTNRTGLCLLHPMSVGGARVVVEHIDGRQSESTFPTLVPPWPPFMLIRAIRHEFAPNRWAHCEFVGDAFELEDQRNNSDASFKTYNRSNLMPRPYWLRAGVALRQTAHLWVDGPVSRQKRKIVRAVSVSVDSSRDGVRDLPRLGTEIIAAETALEPRVLDAVRALNPAHVHLAVGEGRPAVAWERVAKLLASTAAQLRLDVVLRDIAIAPTFLDGLQAELAATQVKPESIAIFPSEQRCIDAARDRFPGIRIGGGTHHFFVQLHRAEGVGAVDFLSFTTSPIVHGTREDEIMLTLHTMKSLVETLRVRYPMPMRIGPSTIGARDSPLGAQPSSNGTRRVTLAREDPRCRGLFGAAWLLGYVTASAQAGVETVTLMSLVGPTGLIECARQARDRRAVGGHGRAAAATI